MPIVCVGKIGDMPSQKTKKMVESSIGGPVFDLSPQVPFAHGKGFIPIFTKYIRNGGFG